MAQKTTTSLIFVPGMASVASTVYAPLVSHLVAHQGYSLSQLRAVDLPSADVLSSTSPPSLARQLSPTALHADIAQIRSGVESELARGNDVILVAHSYGGTPALAASTGLWKHSQSQKPGILRILLISSSLSLPGDSVAAVREAWKASNPQLAPDDASGAEMTMVDNVPVLIPREGMADLWFNDVSDPQIKSSLRPSNLTNVMTPLTDDMVRPGEWVISYLVTTGIDGAMPEELQEHLIIRAREAGAEVSVEKMKSGHFVLCSRVEETAAWIGTEVEKALKSFSEI